MSTQLIQSRGGRPGWLAVVSVCLLTCLSSSRVLGQSVGRDLIAPPPDLGKATAGVRDEAGMFSAEAVKTAREALDKLSKETGVAVAIETIDGLRGDPIDEAAIRLARRSGISGIFVLIARKESKIEVLASRKFNQAFPRVARGTIRSAFMDNFRKDDFNRGLQEGVEAIRLAVDEARREKRLPVEEKAIQALPGPKPPDSLEVRALEPRGDQLASTTAPEGSLVIRNQIKLTLEGARTIVAAAEKQASAMNLKMNIAVVDDGGHLVSFDRMDGARPASGYTALTKASSAATFRQPTGPVPAGTTSPDLLLNLSLQNAALASGGKVTTLYGGVPVVVDGQIIGAVGVGGGSGEQDAQVARAGIQALLDRLSKSALPAAASSNGKSPQAPKTETRKEDEPKKPADGSF